MKKWTIGVGFAAIVIFIVVLMIGLSNLGPVIKTAVNSYGPTLTGTEVRLSKVDISIFSAAAEIKDFFLGNPKGFKSDQAMSVGSIHVNVDEKSLTGDTIIIDRIEVVAPEITYEKIRGTDNFQSILNNVKKATGAAKSAKPSAEKGDKGPGKKLLIKEFIVRDGKVNLATSLLGGKAITAILPAIHLKDIGKKTGGASAADAFKEIFAALHAQITSPEVTGILKDQLDKYTADGKKAVDEIGKQLETNTQEGVKAAAGKLKGLLGN